MSIMTIDEEVKQIVDLFFVGRNAVSKEESYDLGEQIAEHILRRIIAEAKLQHSERMAELNRRAS